MAAVSEFQDEAAVVEAVHLLLGIVGPSSSGKTYSALELATGIQRVDPGPIFVVDSNNRRARRYANLFSYRVVDFLPPYTPMRYQGVAEYCIQQGAKIVIFDSASDMHDGIGGILEWHQRQVKELAKRWNKSEDVVAPSAWIEPKAALKRFRAAITQMDAHFIFCYRGEEKTDFSAKKPTSIGWQAVGDTKMIFELEAKFLLAPCSDGVPTLIPDLIEEKKLVKTPVYFREIFSKPVRLSADIGEKMARWAAGGVPAPKKHPLIPLYIACDDADGLAALEAERAKVWPSLTPAEKVPLKAASDEAKARLATQPAHEEQAPEDADEGEWTEEQSRALDAQIAARAGQDFEGQGELA